MKAPTIPRRIWLIASTVAVIGALFAYYFFVYMEARREELEAKKFRALAQYADNIRGAYAERTKKIVQKFLSGECNNRTTGDCDSVKEFKKARLEVIKPIIAQSDFSELVFQVDYNIEKQTFRNTIDGGIVTKIVKTDNAEIKRQVEFTVNDKDYVIFIHTFDLADRPWRILGFCEKDQFESQVRSVDLKYLVVASLSLAFLLLLMPLLKLLIMNESEKLHMMNVWFCGFSLVVGSSFLLLIVLMSSDFSASYSAHHLFGGKNNLTREDRIKKLSGRVERGLLDELKLIYNQLKDSKSMRYEEMYPCDSSRDHTMLFSNVLNHIEFKYYPFFNEMLWIRLDGSQDFVLSTHELECKQLVNLKTRKYFNQALFKDSSWAMPDSDSATGRFALQSIRSYLTDRHEAGFGTLREESDTGHGVLAIATKLHSIMDPLLPPGYQFVIVDEVGKVWFHSKTEKNLNENFIDETGENPTLIAAINGRSEAMITINYDRSGHRAFVRPIRNTGLTLVVFHDDDFFNTPIVLTVAFAFLLLSFVFVIGGLHQLILLACSYHFSLLKVKRFFLGWLRPEKEKRRIYRRAVWLQVVLIILTACVAVFNNSADLVTFFFVLPIYLTVYHYFSLEYRRIVEEKENPNFRMWMHPFFIGSTLLILFVNLSGVYLFDVQHFGLLFIPQVLVVIICLFFYSWIVSQSSTSPFLVKVASASNSLVAYTTRIFHRLGLRPSSSYDKSYCNFLFLWLIITSVFPTYYFYKVSYFEEGKIWLRYLQLTAARQEESRDVELNNELKEVFKGRLPKMSAMGKFLTVTNEIDTSNERRLQETTHRKPIHEFIFNDVPPLTGVAEETRSVVFPNAGDSKWVSRDSVLYSEMEYHTSQLERRFYHSDLPNYRVLKGDYGPFFLIVLILGPLVLYRTLRFCITHIYGVGLLEHNRYKTPQLLKMERLRYFIVGLPHSGKKKLVKRIQDRHKIDDGNVTTIDLDGDSPITVNSHCLLIVAKGFHRELTNHKSNQRKLERLSKLLEYNGTPVLVVSNTDPTAILEFYDKQAEYYRNEKGDSELDGKFQECRQAHLSWSSALNSFSVHYQKLTECRPCEDEYINAEIGHGDFLPRLYHQLNSQSTSLREREKMVLQVEDLSQTYYRAIWNCLSTSEKFLLHDLAKDRFVNMRNMKTIRAMRQKGLMVGRNSLQLMNRSFNNFILSIVQDDADVKMEQEIRQKGSWNTVHLILVITIISIVVFLGVAQQELFKNFQAILAATAALLPLLARFGGIFSGSKAKE